MRRTMLCARTPLSIHLPLHGSFPATTYSTTTARPPDETPTIISKNGPRPAIPPDTTHANELRGRKLAHFELIEQIGVGGMAAVLRARDTQLDRCVALKILPPDLAVDEENIKRFSPGSPRRRQTRPRQHRRASSSAARINGCTSSLSSLSRATTCGRFSRNAPGCPSSRHYPT